jgi:hypothetical protein
MLRVDHAVLAVADLDATASRLRDRGLATVAGGVHPRWGTANRIASLGNARYVELLSVIDPDVASRSALGRAVSARAREGDRWFALCLAVDDLDATAARLGLTVERGGRELPDGTTVAWRSAGIEDPVRTPDLPFFIAWDVAAGGHPGDATPSHPSGADDIAWIEIAGDPARFEAWVGGAHLPVRVTPGDAGIVSVALHTPGDELVLG